MIKKGLAKKNAIYRPNKMVADMAETEADMADTVVQTAADTAYTITYLAFSNTLSTIAIDTKRSVTTKLIIPTQFLKTRLYTKTATSVACNWAAASLKTAKDAIKN